MIDNSAKLTQQDYSLKKLLKSIKGKAELQRTLKLPPKFRLLTW